MEVKVEDFENSIITCSSDDIILTPYSDGVAQNKAINKMVIENFILNDKTLSNYSDNVKLSKNRLVLINSSDKNKILKFEEEKVKNQILSTIIAKQEKEIELKNKENSHKDTVIESLKKDMIIAKLNNELLQKEVQISNLNNDNLKKDIHISNLTNENLKKSLQLYNLTQHLNNIEVKSKSRRYSSNDYWSEVFSSFFNIITGGVILGALGFTGTSSSGCAGSKYSNTSYCSNTARNSIKNSRTSLVAFSHNHPYSSNNNISNEATYIILSKYTSKLPSESMKLYSNQ